MAGKFHLRHVKLEMPHEKSNWRCPVGCERLKAQDSEKGQSQSYKCESHRHPDGI